MTASTLGSQFRSLRDVVCDDLRDRIVEGRLTPGARLVERDLAEMLDVSRIVIREAIQRLSAEGLVEVLPRRGAQVAALDPESVDNLFEVRLSLESTAARCAAERRTDGDLRRLEAVLVRAREATEQGDAVAAAAANVDFHVALVEAAHNALLTTIIRSLSGQARRVFRVGQDTDSARLHKEHEALFEAIRRRRPRQAENLARDHIQATRVATVERVRQAAAES